MELAVVPLSQDIYLGLAIKKKNKKKISNAAQYPYQYEIKSFFIVSRGQHESKILFF